MCDVDLRWEKPFLSYLVQSWVESIVCVVEKGSSAKLVPCAQLYVTMELLHFQRCCWYLLPKLQGKSFPSSRNSEWLLWSHNYHHLPPILFSTYSYSLISVVFHHIQCPYYLFSAVLFVDLHVRIHLQSRIYPINFGGANIYKQPWGLISFPYW